jgi:hypothetical protein
LPGLIYPKSAIHQNSYFGTTHLTIAAIIQNVIGTPLVEFSSNLVNEPRKKISLINL